MLAMVVAWRVEALAVVAADVAERGVKDMVAMAVVLVVAMGPV